MRQAETQEMRGQGMGPTLNDELAQLPLERRERIETHASDLIAEEMSLRGCGRHSDGRVECADNPFQAKVLPMPSE